MRTLRPPTVITIFIFAILQVASAQAAFADEENKRPSARWLFRPIIYDGINRDQEIEKIRSEMRHHINPPLRNRSALDIASECLRDHDRKIKVIPAQKTIASVLEEANKIYFPKTLGDFKQNWYSKHLIVMGEKSIQNLPNSNTTFVFRFLWLRSFHHPISIRVTKYSDDKIVLAAKELSGKGGFEPGHLIKDNEVNWSKKKFQEFKDKLTRAKFFEQISVDESNRGYDGAQWVFEANDRGRYHFVDKWSAKDPDRALGIFLLGAASVLPCNKSDIY